VASTFRPPTFLEARSGQLEALEAYKKERQKDTLYFEFEDAAALRDHLTRQLPKIVDDVRRHLSPPSFLNGLGWLEPTNIVESSVQKLAIAG